MKKLYFLAVACCLSLVACEDVPAPYELFDPTDGGAATVIPPAGSGTVEDPYNVAMLNEILDNQQETTQAVYFKGIVCKVPSIDTSYGNATYYISDDGKTNVTFEVYRGYSLGGAKFTSEDELQMNDTVVVKGVLTNYNGTYETTAGSSIYSINGRTAGGSSTDTPGADPKGSGTADDPFNVSATLQYTKALGADKNSTSDIYFKGIVSTVKEISPVGNYNNATFYISDDGKTTNEFYVYRCLGFNKGDITSADMVKVGDEVVICGKVVYFKGNTPETVQKESYLVSVNGQGGGTVDPTPDVPAGDAQSVTIADFLAKKDTKTTFRLSGKIVNVVAGKEQYGNFDLQDATGSVYIYGLVDAQGQYTFQAHNLAEGDSLVVEGKYAEFNGKAEVNKALYISHVKANGETPVDPEPVDPTPDTPADPSQLVQNGGFEQWTNGLPDNWKTASSAGNAKLAQSSDAHGGQYSVQVNGTSANQRLGYQETAYAPGTYSVKFFAKALGGATSTYGPQCRPGYVPVSTGSVGTYVYGDYATLSETAWTEVNYTFTLDAQTTICLVVMNAKNSGNILVDDFSITKQ